jgi:hypothetical protein
MIDGFLAEAIAASLRTSFPNVYVGIPQDDGRILMPSITLQLRSDFVVGSPLERGTLTLMVCSQADDTSPHDHTQFVYAVSQFMRSITIDSDVVSLAGIVSASGDEQHAERHWQTPLVYTIGFLPKS